MYPVSILVRILQVPSTTSPLSSAAGILVRRADVNVGRRMAPLDLFRHPDMIWGCFPQITLGWRNVSGQGHMTINIDVSIGIGRGSWYLEIGHFLDQGKNPAPKWPYSGASHQMWVMDPISWHPQKYWGSAVGYIVSSLAGVRWDYVFFFSAAFRCFNIYIWCHFSMFLFIGTKVGRYWSMGW